MDNRKENLPLPDELLLEILLRLPVKSLVRFKCVSKSWLSLISDPQFAKSHFDLAAAPAHRLLYLTDCGSQVRFIDFETSLHDYSILDLPLPKSYDSFCYGVQIMGSCRGFILFYYDGQHLILWNPSTGVLKPISFSFVDRDDFMFNEHLYGFGYDASKDDYLVAILWDNNIFELFSLRTNSWKIIEDALFPDMIDSGRSGSGSFLNGAIHWLVFSGDKPAILAFDLIEKNLFEIPLPDDFIEWKLRDSVYSCDLRVMGRSLSLCFRSSDKTDIWVMKQYRLQSSWTKYEFPRGYLFPICSAKGGELVAIDHSVGDGAAGFMKLNGKGELLEHHNYSFYEFASIPTMYIESLLSFPPCDSIETSKDDPTIKDKKNYMDALYMKLQGTMRFGSGSNLPMLRESSQCLAASKKSKGNLSGHEVCQEYFEQLPSYPSFACNDDTANRHYSAWKGMSYLILNILNSLLCQCRTNFCFGGDFSKVGVYDRL